MIHPSCRQVPALIKFMNSNYFCLNWTPVSSSPCWCTYLLALKLNRTASRNPFRFPFHFHFVSSHTLCINAGTPWLWYVTFMYSTYYACFNDQQCDTVILLILKLHTVNLNSSKKICALSFSLFIVGKPAKNFSPVSLTFHFLDLDAFTALLFLFSLNLNQ